MSEEELLGIADELYGLGLEDFTPARDARVRALKGQGDLPRRVKALRKPSTAAWVVNLLARHESEQVQQVLAVGAALREAQATMSAEELRALTKQRRQLTAAVTTRARALAREHGHKVTEAVAEQVEATLTAAMVDEQCAAAVRSGLLLTALASTGVDEVDVAAAVAAPEALGFTARPREAREAEPRGRPELSIVPDPDAAAKARAAAEEVLEAADEEVSAAQEALAEAVSAVQDLEARGLQVQAEMDELRRRLAELEATYDEVDEELSEAEDARAEAEEAVREATEERDAARAALEGLGG